MSGALGVEMVESRYQYVHGSLVIPAPQRLASTSTQLAKAVLDPAP